VRTNRALSIILAALILLPGKGRAKGARLEGSEGDRGETSVVAQPWMHADLPLRSRRRLSAAFSAAVVRLRENADCRQLFETFGVEGAEMLAQTLYFRPTVRDEQRFCPGTSAFTSVGGRVTRVCRGFGRLPESRAVAVLIHEALHQAGMSEKPRDPLALDSAQINQLVIERCSL
jgi:hypothetical protein